MRYFSFIFVLIVALLGYFLLPSLFMQIPQWQREFNQLISQSLSQLQQHRDYAGLWLMAISFIYGVLHAVGPGHGKFVIATYLATHKTQLKNSMALTFLSSLMQGVVAIVVTSIVVVVLNLSSHYFKLSQLWLERTAFILILGLGINWCYQNIKKLYQSTRKPDFSQIKTFHSLQPANLKVGQSAVQNLAISADCGCGHQHLPTPNQLQHKSIKQQLLLILTIGMRPCSGAIFVLFFSYMLDLYGWGMFATLAMSIGTGMMLSLFALLVHYARNSAIKLGKWYQFTPKWRQNAEYVFKCVAGIILIFFATSLLYGTTLSSKGGMLLFGS